ncbi:MAG TPA: pilus assembly PilX N-terminal domain-containing protein [Acidobacteriota bacterium]|nr:pilus assembly PilX N-terminal domain-containing protein [Acidobacteriota bacterium]
MIRMKMTRRDLVQRRHTREARPQNVSRGTEIGGSPIMGIKGMIANERGAAMLIALGILMMIALIGAAVVKTSSTDMGIAENYQHDLRSFYVAEAGVEHTYGVVRDSTDWRDGFTDASFAGGSYSVTLTDSTTDVALEDTIVLISTGTFSNAVSAVEVKLAPLKPFQWAAFAKDYMMLCGDTYTDSYDSDSGSYAATASPDDGDVGSNGQLDICGSADINGDAATSEPGGLEITGFADVSGDTTSDAPVYIFDPIPQSAVDYAVANSMAPAGLSGTFTYNSSSKNLRLTPGQTMTMASGIYYFEDVTVNGTINLAPGAQVEIYIGGDVDIQAFASINMGGAAADMIIYGVGPLIKFAAGAELTAVIYAPDVDIHLTGGCDIYGAFVGNVAHDAGGSAFHYDRALRDLELDKIYNKVCWREL